MASIPYRSCSFVLAALASLVGCAGSAPEPLTAAARHDLQCEQVELSEAGRDRFAASGCGRGVLYAKSCGDKGCAWTRLPTGAEPPPPPTSGSEQVSAAPAPPREIIQAPPPAQREVIPAPPPADAQMRQVIPAPPPANGDAANGPQSDAAALQPGDAQQPYAAQQTPLEQGELSAPYQAEVPSTPTVMRSEYPPPAPLVETRPVPPQPSSVWVTGYWWWSTPAWVWAPGYWCAPRYGFNYVPGSWYWSTGAWWYGPGGWARPGSTLIVEHVHSRPSRWTTTRSFRPYHHVTGYGYAPPSRVAPKSANYGYAGPTRSYAPSRGYAPSYGRAPASTPGTRYAPATGFSPGRYVSGNTRPEYAPNRAVVGARGYGPAQAPRSFTPQQSPLYRYPTQLNNPMRSPARSSGATWGSAGGGGVRERAPMTGYGYQGSRSSGGSYGGARVAPRQAAPTQQAPVFRSAPIQTAPHDVARGRAYGAPASSFRGSAAPIRMPSGGGGGGGRSAPRGARVAPRR
ncbi:MAG: hypothetical protein ABW252_09150 [Polyangiales bacterium]